MRLEKKIGILLLLASTCALGQGNDPAALQKEAQLLLEQEDYYRALPLYKRVLQMEKKNGKAAVNAAVCLFKMNYSSDSLVFLAPYLNTTSLPDAKYYLARIYHLQKRFDEAMELLKAYKEVSVRKRMHSNEEADYQLRICENAKKLTSNPRRSVIKNVGPAVNSPYPDYMPVVAPDESYLYFTSRRAGGNSDKKDAYGKFFEDVYVSHKVNGAWTKAENIGPPVNSETNDACLAISADGQRMLVFRTATDMISGDLYTTRLGNDNRWETLRKMDKEINSQFIESSACFSNDTSEIYFSSNRPGGYGGKDIYRIKKLPNGKWGLPYNLGPNVNTLYDEDAPFLHPDNVTLFFSSKGHDGMGGYDVFKSLLNPESNQFSKAENLGYPINSVGDDIFFVLNVNGQKGYYSSVKDDTHGGNDLYEIDTRFGDNDLIVKSGFALLGDDPGKVKITLLDIENNQVNGIYNSNPKTGKFILVVNPLKQYKAIVEREGYNTLVVELEPLFLEKVNKDLEFKLAKK